uniref:inactive peptidyl-prolyl cis-trans isomerase FKBP6 isoform X3 n=2 Tax=Macaca TaxID=9539 RepID=UPI000760051D|nr:PREDICTED: inactive peptidyl-prolyl cis-trans isomerase FKBP6 isoform X2 [Macaca fascicularis]XP_028701508.1 inactive peptidyl-prolyl cis-trans isomerase FKBP6 isoform X3 [Macaca mulatta]
MFCVLVRCPNIPRALPLRTQPHTPASSPSCFLSLQLGAPSCPTRSNYVPHLTAPRPCPIMPRTLRLQAPPRAPSRAPSCTARSHYMPPPHAPARAQRALRGRVTYPITFRALLLPAAPRTSRRGLCSSRARESQGRWRQLERNDECLLVAPEWNAAIVKYSGYLEHMDRPFDSNYFRKTPRLMKLGEDITLWGMELGLLSMRRGELARFLFKPNYAYGTLGCPPLIPPNTTVLFEIELLDFLDSAESDKFCALSAALLLLRRRSAPSEAQHLVEAAKLPVLLNLSFTYLKLDRPTIALRYGEQALIIDQKNAKALFRCGQACLLLTEYQKARDFLVRAQREQPFNHDINNELKKLASDYRDYVDKEKEMWHRMFARCGDGSTAGES